MVSGNVIIFVRLFYLQSCTDNFVFLDEDRIGRNIKFIVSFIARTFPDQEPTGNLDNFARSGLMRYPA